MSKIYNYNDLKSEIEEDLNNGVLELEDDLYVIRRAEPIFDDYRPILDFEYRDIPGESFEKMTVGDCLKEMNEMSKLRSVK